MLMARVVTCTQFKRNYMDASDMWDAAWKVGWVQWGEVCVKIVWRWRHPGVNLYCEATTKSISPLLVCHPIPEKCGLCEEGSGPNLGEN
jgi:hypothetical protein